MTESTMKQRGASQGALVEHKPQTPATQPESRGAVQTEASRLVVIDQPIGEIAGAIASVMAEVGVVQRAGVNQFHHYKYATMGDILIEITPLIGKAGLAIFQNEISRAIVGETRVTVTYEFAITHKSGQYWPERPRFTGMCNAKTKGGDLDDKAINKCHTAARKYFLLSLFQVPTGDIDDSDNDAPRQTAQQRPAQNHSPVPGPGLKEITPEAKAKSSQEAIKEGIPHKIVLGQGTGADQWANAYIKALGTAKTLDELKAWDTINDGALQGIHERYKEVYDLITQAYEMREAGLTGADPQTGEVIDNNEIVVDEMTDPANDPTAAVNWVAQRLIALTFAEDIAEFWSEYVKPRLGEFSEPDIAVMEGELRRANARVAGQRARG